MIVITDYIGHSDKSGMPMGHPVKVLNESIRLLDGLTSLSIAVPANHLNMFNALTVKKAGLPNNVYAFSSNKIGNFKKKWINLFFLFRHVEGVPFFINVDFSLFLFLFLFVRKRPYWISLCYNPLKEKSNWRRYIIERVLKRASVIVVTNKHFLEVVPGNTIFIPDYYYIPEIYSCYKTKKIKNSMVCLGTMGKNKKLESIIRVFNNSKIKLKIIGNFNANLDRFINLKKIASTNIEVENRFVSNDEYYEIMGASEYVILPYDMELYEERTSGILIESVFLDCIPVAPRQLLDYNDIKGIGYTNIEEVFNNLFNNDYLSSIRDYNRKLITSRFDQHGILTKIKCIIPNSVM